MNAKAKTINLLLYSGNLNGVISIEDSSWNSGELYSSPRDSVSDLLKTDACSKYGVYLLLSQDMVYVGQSFDLSKRLNQHMTGKDWWESAVILTTKDDSLTHSDIDYLENVLIEKAFKIERLDCDNKKKGNPPKVDKFRKVVLEQYLEEALFLMQLIGINVFSDNIQKGRISAKPHIDVMSISDKLSLGISSKSEALAFLKEQRVILQKTITYATLKPNKDSFWLNPKVPCVNLDWNIVLNDTAHSELIVIFIPANTFVISSDDDKKGLALRSDKPDLIELRINKDTLFEKKSKTDFSKYVQAKIKY
ncbi:MAG: GIY-YIG nuclease family protein [Oscillospiraceae bacterium]